MRSVKAALPAPSRFGASASAARATGTPMASVLAAQPVPAAPEVTINCILRTWEPIRGVSSPAFERTYGGGGGLILSHTLLLSA